MEENLKYVIDEICEKKSTIDIEKLKLSVNEQHETLVSTKNNDPENVDDFELCDETSIVSMINAKAEDYASSYNKSELVNISEYYNIKSRNIKKSDLALIIASFELEPKNKELVQKREYLWHCFSELKQDPFFLKYITATL